MKESIKKRIEAVRRGEVPDGYRRDKLGIVPTEWEDKVLGDILTQRKTLMCVSEEAPLLSFTIEEGVIDPKDKKSNKRDFLIKDMATKKFALTEVGDIIYNPANLKFGAIHRNSLKRGVVSPIYGIFYGAPNSKFMGYFLHDQRFIDYAKTYTEGSVEKLKTLSADAFLKLKVTIPSLPEQEKIAEILATCDRVIELKQQLLEEKRRQKQWLMMKLLDPNSGVRLPRFNGIWKRCKLGKLGATYSGLSGKSEGDFGEGAPYIPYVNIFSNPIVDTESFEYVRVGSDEKQLRVQYGDIFFTTSSETPAEIGMSSVYLGEEQELYLNSFCFGFRLNNFKSLVPEYAAYSFRGIALRKTLYKLAQGATRYNLSKTDFMKETIVFPPTIREQQAIANILKTADLEIETIQKDLDAWQQKKKALMQLLLTGLVRVNA